MKCTELRYDPRFFGFPLKHVFNPSLPQLGAHIKEEQFRAAVSIKQEQFSASYENNFNSIPASPAQVTNLRPVIRLE